MLDSETKRRIDTARDILVGKVPDPKSQVEQITIALIYKFMDDMDAESEELGGERKFFEGEFAKYGWAKLMRSGLGGHEMLGLYGDAISRMPENPGIPPLFRDIFKNAYLPYRDPETLRAFLRIIDDFTYDHSERLGDAFEYLLSVLGSQGDAGQFRTPRHIIDFMVSIVDPKKDETVLDPACGTAGFLISSYKHILAANTDADGNSTLTPDQRGRLAGNFKGYDISPDMVRLSLVNMYLHGFTDPHIYEYDTLTSQDRWNEYADVILANPPFMSPKGGIKPHNRFSVQSKRSEVLFVDYMAEHLTPNGRAGIIVPEGVMFLAQTAYRNLRRMLVDDYLVAVVSLPAGVFNPYSGVKTSILILDKSLASRTNWIAFFGIKNDGFNLGAQRRPIDKNDLPQAGIEIAEFLRRIRVDESLGEYGPTLGLLIPKERVASSGDYNLNGERYRDSEVLDAAFPTVSLGELLRLDFGTRITKREHEGSLYPVFGGGGESFRTDTYTREDDVVISRFAMSPECVRVVRGKFYLLDSGFTYSVAEPYLDKASKEYISQILLCLQDQIYSCARGHAQKNIDISAFKMIVIPLPPLDVQQFIAAEIRGYQSVIDGARAVLDSYRPRIPFGPSWPMVPLGELCVVERGASPRPIHAFITKERDGVNWIKIGDAQVGAKYITETKERITPEGAARSRHVKSGDFILSNSMSYGRPYIMATEGCIHDGWLLLRITSGNLDQDYLYSVLSSDVVSQQFDRVATGGVVKNLNSGLVRSVKIPLPPLSTQKAIVAEIDTEQALVNANQELIVRFEKKIHATAVRVWNEEEPSATVSDCEVLATKATKETEASR